MQGETVIPAGTVFPTQLPSRDLLVTSFPEST